MLIHSQLFMAKRWLSDYKDSLFFIKLFYSDLKSQKYFQSVHHEDAADAGLAYLMRVHQLELLGALIEIVMQGDAAAPALDLPALGPKPEINGVARLEQAERHRACSNG